MKLVLILLILAFFFTGCFSPPLEPVFDFKKETRNLKENQTSRKKTSDPSELEQICIDNESGRARALDAYLKMKEVSEYWKKVAEGRKSDAEFGRSIKNWITVFLIGGAVSLFAGIFLYVSGIGSKAIGGISKILSIFPPKSSPTE
ncbi:hypothetical protein JWG45_17280 [Leptospira sp. 201903070]|uniref:Lipoprotein n=1 Tax=Leptospira ainlahdjerensis TaxID=2810033 RepID=A0ABS2UEU4_9LEPT|nr:hypothetical protein [Leptospira ainlahdjerensis]MBM9578901.1 hypothetical protein [Leptospira ainlahdjerensis]